MPTYFYQNQLRGYRSNQAVVCNSNIDRSFLLEIVDDFKQILAFMPSGMFPATLTADIQYETEAAITENIVLSLQGTVQYLYYRVYGDIYPVNPTIEDIKKINDIWIGIGHPENIITI
jgi:hypothetical protein